MAGKTGKYSKSSGDWKALYVPRTIYFYHNSTNGVRVYLWMNPDDRPIHQGDELDELIVRLTRNARGSATDPRPIGKSFSDVPWWRRSYIIVATETDTFDDGDAVEINRSDGHPNHCFFDGGDGSMTIDGRIIHLMWTVNYMMDKNGNKIASGKTHNFRWDFNPGRPDIEDGNGTNMGPPVAPP